MRQAISHTIDRETTIGKLYGGFGIPWATASCKTSNGYNPDLKLHEYDPDKARSLLKESGYADGFEYNLGLTQLEAILNLHQL